MKPWFGLHLPSYSFPETPPERLFDREVVHHRGTMGTPVVVVADPAQEREYLDRVPAERRQHMIVGPPERAADGLQPYLEAGFTGFTLNNSIFRTPDAIRAVGDTLRLIGG